MFISEEKKIRRKKYKTLRKIRQARDIASKSRWELYTHPYKMSLVLKHFSFYLESPKATVSDIAYDLNLFMPRIIKRIRSGKIPPEQD